MKKWFILLVAVISLTVMSSVDAVTLSVDSGSGKLGTGQHQISIHLTNDMPVRGIQLKMADIPDFLTADSVVITSRTQDFSVSFSDTLGFLTILLYSWNLATIPPGDGEVLTIFYSIPESVREETVNIVIFEEDLKVVGVVDGENVPQPVEIQNGTFLITGLAEAGSTPPHRYALEQNYPNPFNPTTRIPFQLARSGHVRIEIFNALGQSTALLQDNYLPAGSHAVQWDGRSNEGELVPGGLYFYRLQTEGYRQTRSLLLLK